MASSSQVRASRREQLEASRLAQAQKERRARILIVGAGVVLFAIVLGLALWGFLAGNAKSGNGRPPNSTAAGDGILAAPLVPGVPTLEIYTDYNCAYCQSSHFTLSALIDDAVDAGTLNVIYRARVSLHASSRSAAMAAACADVQGMFQAYDDALYRNQSSDGFTTNTLLVTIPEHIGLTGEALSEFTDCFGESRMSSFIDAQVAQAAKQKVNQSPTFFLNGEDITIPIFNENTGTYDPDLLRAVIGL